MSFLQNLENVIHKNNSLLSIGLDPDLARIPRHLLHTKSPIFVFNKEIIDKTHDLVCAYKPQIAYYAAYGADGLNALLNTVQYIKKNYPDIPVILDAKRADIESTSQAYAKEVFDVINADAVTVNPYLGFDALQPFLDRTEKGVIILCRTSNPGAADFQDLDINGEPLYIIVARKAQEWNKKTNNCLLVVGATWPQQVKQIRTVAKDMFFLIPGIGTQGGDLENTLKNGLRDDKSGLIINSARAIIYASNRENFADKARTEAQKIKNEINQIRFNK